MLAIAALVLTAGASSVRAEREPAGANRLRLHQQKHREYQEQFAASVKKTADFCETSGFAEEAVRLRKLAEPADLQTLRFEPLPKTVQPEIRSDLPAEERRWRSELRHAQQDYAKDLYLLAQRLVNQGFSSYAFEVVREAAFHDPDNRPVRSVLGYVRHDDQWVTPFKRDMLKKKHVWHETYGWLPANHVARYDAGERFFKDRFVSARQEAELRRDFKNAWEVRTDHFLVKTNHSLERGVEVGVALEDFHDFFNQAFAAFFLSPEQLKKLFSQATRSFPPPDKPHEVNYFATKEEYVARLKPKIPQIDITNGLYYTNDRTAFFFHDAAVQSNDATLYHEATHQLLYENGPNAKDRPIGQKEQFWIIEGIACYMESFRREGGRISVGDPRSPRFVAARYRFLHDKYYIPLETFDAMGMNQFQNDPNISKNYSQASGLAQFFMHYDGGKYRDALIEHLSQHYSERRRTLPSPESLSDLTGVPNEDLDKQYGAFMTEVQNAVRSRGEPRTEPQE